MKQLALSLAFLVLGLGGPDGPPTMVECAPPTELHLVDPINLALMVEWQADSDTKVWIDGYYLGTTSATEWTFQGYGYGVDISDAHVVGLAAACSGSLSPQVEKMIQVQWVEVDWP